MKKLLFLLFFILVLTGCEEGPAPKLNTSADNNAAIAIQRPYEYILESRGLNTAFINSKVGWRATYTDQDQGMFKGDMTLEQTKDGGKSWIKIADTRQEGSTLPGGDVTGFTFLNEQDGWITLYIPGRIGLYRTTDGGVTWEEQQLTVTDTKFGDFNTFPPLFFSSMDGVLFANPYTDSQTNAMLFYITNDGGQTWHEINNQAKGQSGQIKWNLLRQSETEGQYDITYRSHLWRSKDVGASWVQMK